jgi:hypothetical protein
MINLQLVDLQRTDLRALLRGASCVSLVACLRENG